MHTHPIAVMMDEPAPEEPRTALGLLSELTVALFRARRYALELAKLEPTGPIEEDPAQLPLDMQWEEIALDLAGWRYFLEMAEGTIDSLLLPAGRVAQEREGLVERQGDLVGMARRMVSDPAEPEEHRQNARKFLEHVSNSNRN